MVGSVLSCGLNQEGAEFRPAGNGSTGARQHNASEVVRVG